MDFVKNFGFSNKKSDHCISNCIFQNDEEFVVAGYPDDEGVKLNGGRLGASRGPDSIRSVLYKMTVPASVGTRINDLGNLSFEDSTIADRHEFVGQRVEETLNEGKNWIGLGGGHDYAYPDGIGFLKSCSDSPFKPIIVNFDAHFDLRGLDKGITSGTPFYRLIKSDIGFELFEVGIQKQCNDQDLFHYALENKIHTLNYDDLYPDGAVNFDLFKKTIDDHSEEKAPCFVSVDIDGFSSQYAPGCSQSWPVGIDPVSFFKMFSYLMERFEVRVLGVYEVAPPLDLGPLTSRLAALIVYRYLVRNYA